MMELNGNLDVLADNRLQYVGILGGAQVGKGNSIGATVGVLVVGNQTVAQLGDDVTALAGGEITVAAEAVTTAVEVVVNASV